MVLSYEPALSREVGGNDFLPSFTGSVPPIFRLMKFTDNHVLEGEASACLNIDEKSTILAKKATTLHLAINVIG